MAELRWTELERAVLEKLLAGEHPVFVALREQLRTCRITSREFTGCGFFTNVEVARGVPPAPTNQARCVIWDVDASVPSLEFGVGFVLFVDGGFLNCLEGFTYGEESWPEHFEGLALRYSTESRDIPALKLDGP